MESSMSQSAARKSDQPLLQPVANQSDDLHEHTEQAYQIILTSGGSLRKLGPRLADFLKIDSDVNGKNLKEFLHPKFAEAPSGQELLELFAEKKALDSPPREIVFVSNNGYPLALWGRFLATPSGDTIQFDGVDITPLWQELHVRTEIMNQTSIVSEANLRGDIMNVNSKFLEVSKYSHDELIGKPHNTTRHPDMPKEVFKEMWATIGRGQLFRGVVKNRAKDGTPYYVDACIAPVIGSNGKPRKYLGVRYEFTKAELERQNANGTIAAIDESYVRAEFDLEGKLIFCNKPFEKMVGGTFDTFKGRPLMGLRRHLPLSKTKWVRS